MSRAHVIIGSGPDAMAAAIVLAEAGREVHVFEAHGGLGGRSWSRSEFAPGYWAPGLHHDVRVDASLIRKLCGSDAAVILGSPPPIDTPAGRIPGDPLAPCELPGWEARRAWLSTVRRGLRTVVRAPAPPFTQEGSVWPLMRIGASLRWMGKPALRQLLRRGALSIQDDLDEELAAQHRMLDQHRDHPEVGAPNPREEGAAGVCLPIPDHLRVLDQRHGCNSLYIHVFDRLDV